MARVAGVLPIKLIAENVFREGSVLRFGDLTLSSEKIRNLYVIGAGKAEVQPWVIMLKLFSGPCNRRTYYYKVRTCMHVETDKGKEAGHPVPDYGRF